jgi:hypothetical protein
MEKLVFPASFFIIIRNGFIRIFRFLLFSSGIIVSTFLSGVLIVLPLWLFATRLPRVYTVVTLAISAAFAAAYFIRSIYRKYRSSSGMNDFFRNRILPKLKIGGIAAIFIAGLYTTALLFTISPGAAVPSSILFVLWVAYVVSRKKTGPPSEKN